MALIIGKGRQIFNTGDCRSLFFHSFGAFFAQFLHSKRGHFKATKWVYKLPNSTLKCLFIINIG